jgi:hypothetical protein
MLALLIVKFGLGSMFAWPWLPVIGAGSTFLAGWIASVVSSTSNSAN